MRPSHEQDEMQLLLEMQLRLPRHIKVRFIRPVRLIPPKKVPHRTDGRIASRKEATLQNLTQRLPWGRTVRERTCGIECTTCGNKRTRFSPQGAFTPAKVRLLFHVSNRQAKTGGVCRALIFLQRRRLSGRPVRRWQRRPRDCTRPSARQCQGIPLPHKAREACGTASSKGRTPQGKAPQQ